ncbi:MAG TPA: VWA domain-containing protein [Acidobacteriaceae bacterium]|nr:VWA domain-containing protein [Acidobacteriaceae bacterium]
MPWCQGWTLAAQMQPTASSQSQPAIPAAANNPVQPEVQPNLAVDRDPVSSPDPEVNAPVSGQSLTNSGKPGELQKGEGGIYTLHQDVNEVLLNCTVLDEKGRLVLDLKRGNFRLWEDGVPQAVDSFQHQDLPVSMGILVDNSGSMRDKRAAVNAAALDLVRASNPEDAAFVVNFSDKAYLDQNFTSNIAALERGLSHFDSRSTTALYDAVVASATELANHAKQPKEAVLIITDGADNASRVSLEQAIQRVQNLGGPVVYSIGLLFGDDKEESQTATKALQTLSQETGGVAYFPRSLEDVDEIAREVAQDIRNQYSIGYHSTKSPNLGGYRTISVEATAPNHGKLTVRTRKGYYPKVAQNPTVAVAK